MLFGSAIAAGIAFWGIALGAVAAVLAATGSLRVIQTASIATAFPLMFLLLLVLYGTFKGLSEYRKAESQGQSAGRGEIQDLDWSPPPYCPALILNQKGRNYACRKSNDTESGYGQA